MRIIFDQYVYIRQSNSEAKPITVFLSDFIYFIYKEQSCICHKFTFYLDRVYVIDRDYRFAEDFPHDVITLKIHKILNVFKSFSIRLQFNELFLIKNDILY